MTGIVWTADISEFLLKQEQFFSTAELSYARSLLNWVPYEKSCFDGKEYIEYLRSKQLKAHKQHAGFALDVFEECGAHYSQLWI